MVEDGSTEDLAGEQDVCVGEEAAHSGQVFVGCDGRDCSTGVSQTASQEARQLFCCLRGCSLRGHHSLDLQAHHPEDLFW